MDVVSVPVRVRAYNFFRLTNFAILVTLFNFGNLEDLFQEGFLRGIFRMLGVIKPIVHRFHRHFFKFLDVEGQLLNGWALLMVWLNNHLEDVDKEANSLYKIVISFLPFKT